MGTYQDLYDKLKGNPEELQQEIEAAVRINREAILTDLVRQSSTFATWGYLLSLAETEAKRLKFNVEEDVLPAARLSAIVILHEQKQKVTERAKDDLAHSDPSYKQIQQKLIVAQERVAIYKRVVEAMVHKRDMLQSLNSRQKVELTALPADEASWAGTYGMTDESKEDLAPKIHESVVNEGADLKDLARQYRSKRREMRTEK